MISEAELQQALTYLAETDEKHARAKGLMKGLEKQEKTIIAVGFASQEGPQEQRKQNALLTPNYKKWQDQYTTAVIDYEILNNKRSTEATIIEVWRSLNAGRRKGNI